MEARTRDLLFGSGRGHEHLRGSFTPRGWSGAAPEKGSILATFRGFGSEGKGRDRVLGMFERSGMINAEQRAAGGVMGTAADGAAETVRSLVGSGPGAAGATTGAANVAPQAAQQLADPVYGGLYAQMMMRDQGFVPPMAAAATTTAPAASAAATDGSATIAAAAEDIAANIVSLEQRWQSSLERLVELPGEQQVPTIARAVDSTAAAGLGDDAFGVLGAALEMRPLEHAAPALENALVDLVHVAPGVDDVAKVAAPTVVEAAMPVFSGLASRSLLLGGEQALQGAMPFAAGVDDTIRLLARIR